MAHLMRLLNVGVHVVASVKPGARDGQGRPKKEQKDIDIHSLDRTFCMLPFRDVPFNFSTDFGVLYVLYIPFDVLSIFFSNVLRRVVAGFHCIAGAHFIHVQL